jgi:hypothetical protein
MKTILKYSTILAFMFVISACSSESESTKYSNPANTSNSRYVSDAKLHSFVYQEIDTCIAEKIIIIQNNNETDSKTPKIIPENTSTPISANSDLIIKIDELENNLIAMQNYSFTDCSQTESKIILLTEDFFYIVEKIDTNDSVCISMFNKLDSFAELLEPSLIEAEESCPDLYNEYMEIIDDYNDIYADKLGLIFSSNQ